MGVVSRMTGALRMARVADDDNNGMNNVENSNQPMKANTPYPAIRGNNESRLACTMISPHAADENQ